MINMKFVIKKYLEKSLHFEDREKGDESTHRVTEDKDRFRLIAVHHDGPLANGLNMGHDWIDIIVHRVSLKVVIDASLL
jgi:hypothetical protein